MDIQETTPQIDGPISLLPDLTAWGIEEVDRGVCEDTSYNRLVIRDNKARFQPVFDSNGEPTGHIQVITSEMSQALSANKSVLLTDSRDRDSDYITGIMLIVEPAADHLVPAWVLSATRHWVEVDKKRRETGEKFRPALLGPPSRCAAKKVDGHRCGNWTNGTVDYGDFCRVHLTNRPNGEAGKTPGHLQMARNRLQSAAVAAVDELETLMATATGEGTRLNAAKEILDRAGVRGGFEVEQQVTVVKPAADIVRERLADLLAGHAAKAEIEAKIYGEDHEGEGEIEYAEVVEDTETNDR